MDDNTKLYVFSKKEVALIFLFLFLIALTSFAFGVKIGKDYSIEKAGITAQDKARVELLSGQEEKVNEVVEEVQTKEEKPQEELQNLNQKLEEHIKAETSGEGETF
jgi:hypothetical protein